MVRRGIWLLWQCLVVLVVTLLAAEGLLQVAALFGRDREGIAKASGAGGTILCIGDSHTYGSLVAPEESYPAQLQRLLDERAPNAYAVANLGVPGYNTTLARERLQRALARNRPDVVIVWCGANNSWNRSGPDDVKVSWRTRLDTWASRNFRVLRLLRVWRRDYAIDAELARLGGRAPDLMVERNADGTVAAVSVTGQATPEQTRYVRGDVGDERTIEDGLVADYRAMIDDARRVGARTILITYGIEFGPFQIANRALRRVALESNVPLIETSPAYHRVPPEHRKLLPGGHPNGVIYGEVARDLVAAVVPPTGRRTVAPGVLASLDFATAVADAPGNAPSAIPIVVGPCGYSTPACDGDRGCFRWRPEGGRCSVDSRLSVYASAVEATARVRLGDAAPAGERILGLMEEHFGTGVFVDLMAGNRLQAKAIGSREEACGPLERPLEAERWYGIRLYAEKSESATIVLELLDAGGTSIDRVRCSPMPAGLGIFTMLRVGSGAPSSTGSIDFADVQVRAATPQSG